MPAGALLTVAICLEVLGTSALRQSDGFTRPGWIVLMACSYGVALYLLSVVVRELPLGMTYAIWSAAGTALIAIVGVAVFDEHVNAISIAGFALIIAGIVVLNLA